MINFYLFFYLTFTTGNELCMTGTSNTIMVMLFFLYFRKLCARVKELELWKKRNMLQCGSSGRAHHLTGIYHLTMTNQINKTVFCVWSVT